MTSRAGGVLLDRDGVLIRSRIVEGRPYPVNIASDVVALPGAIRACRTLVANGLGLVVVTNQPDVARGSTTVDAVEAINSEVRRLFPIEDIKTCFHDDVDGCTCRKPLPGMLIDAIAERHWDPVRSVMVGDRWRDIEAGRRARCLTVLVDGGHHEPVSVAPDHVSPSLLDAVPWILTATDVSE